ncbi:Asp-tRNA(Asn)/Glu-tRNA(Gln) amidotransferase subunit GatA [Candidatus Babeliales bacterium]|nr:Asp-tRNA(Asn)/Glu-tRNA(Gln) amidotransferase subunit GatA [Candidatus Babeliales bacterium]
MKDLAFLTIKELKGLLESGEVSHEQMLSYFIARAEQHKELGAALETFDKESILKDFKSLGSLAAIPGYIKDNISQNNRNLTCASKMLEGFKSVYDATVVDRLKAEGAFLVGRANMDEFAMGSSGETSAYFKTQNPWARDCVPGGSSSGSAAAVAAGLAPWALGTDTGGSVRQPAGMCGIVGLKPTYGLVSRYGVVAYGSSLDQVGVLTRSVYDNALVFSTIAGHDLKDSSSLSVEKKDYTQNLDGEFKKDLRIGVVTEALEGEGLHPEIKEKVQEALKVYESMGAKIIPVSMKTLQYGAASYFIISRAEAASNLARFDGVRYGTRNKSRDLNEMYQNTRHDGFGAEVKARILVGNYVLSVGHAGEFYDNAQRVRRVIRKEFKDAFDKVDILVMPSHSVPAFKVGEYDNDKLAMDLQDYFTAPMNLAGIPALSIPVGFTKDKKPVGMQLIGPHLSEGLLYQVGYAYEQKTSWHTMHPEL